MITKEKKIKRGNLDNNEKEQLRKYKKRKKAMRENLDDEQKQQLKIEQQKEKSKT